MNGERFLTLIEQCLGGGTHPGMLARDEAAQTLHAVLGAVALCLTPEACWRLAAALPEPLTRELLSLPHVRHGETSAAEVVARVAAELGVEPDAAYRRIHCTLRVLRECIGADAWDKLPDELTHLSV